MRRSPLGGLAHDGEDGALHRVADRLVGALGRHLERRREQGPVDAVLVVGDRQRLGEATQDLRQDHAAVASSPHERAVADGLAGGREVGLDAVELGHDRLQREGHVAPGVAIGHRIDVQPVDALLVGCEGIPEGGDRPPEVVGAQPLEGRHGGAAYRLAEGRSAAVGPGAGRPRLVATRCWPLPWSTGP